MCRNWLFQKHCRDFAAGHCVAGGREAHPEALAVKTTKRQREGKAARDKAKAGKKEE